MKEEGVDVIYNSTFAGYFPTDNPKFTMIIAMYGNKKPLYYASQVAVPVFGNIVDKMAAINVLNLSEEIIKPKRKYVRAGLPTKALGYSEDFKKVMNYLEIPYKKEQGSKWSKLDKNLEEMVFGDFQFKSKLVPDVRGMGVRDAIYILEKMNMKVEIEGYGKVYSQSIPPKTKRNKQQIKLILK